MTKAQIFFAFFFLTSSMTWAETHYTVRRGDTLLSIADRELGSADKKDPRRYEWARKIRAKNPQIKNPDALEPGDTLTLPDFPRKTQIHATPVAPPAKTESVAIALKPAKGSGPIPQVVVTDSAAEHAAVAATPTPAPTAAPVELPHPPAAPKEEAHHEGHSDFIGLQPRFQTLDLKATNTTTKEDVKMKSKSSMGLDLQYGKILSDKAHLLAQVGYTSTEFGEIEGLNATINHSREQQMSYALGFAYAFTDSLHFDAMAMMAERTFMIPVTGNTYELKAIMVPGAELNLSWSFWKGSNYAVGASAIAEYLDEVSKDDIKYKSAIEPVGALYWMSKNGHDHVNYKANLIYRHGHQHTSVSDQAEEAISAGLMVMFPL